jgi:hypothetical protein
MKGNVFSGEALILTERSKWKVPGLVEAQISMTATSTVIAIAAIAIKLSVGYSCEFWTVYLLLAGSESHLRIGGAFREPCRIDPCHGH